MRLYLLCTEIVFELCESIDAYNPATFEKKNNN